MAIRCRKYSRINCYRVNTLTSRHSRSERQCARLLIIRVRTRGGVEEDESEAGCRDRYRAGYITI